MVNEDWKHYTNVNMDHLKMQNYLFTMNVNSYYTHMNILLRIMNSNPPANPHSFVKMKRKEKMNQAVFRLKNNILYSSAFQGIQSLSIYFHTVYQWIGLVHALPTNNDALPAVFFTNIWSYMEFCFYITDFCMPIKQPSQVPFCCFSIHNYHCWS